MTTSAGPWPDSIDLPLLTVMTITPLAGLLAASWARSSKLKIHYAVTSAGLNMIFGLYLLLNFDSTDAGLQFAEHYRLFGVNYSVGVDGLNILFIPLISCISWLILLYLPATPESENERFTACILGYQALLTAAFCATNALQFWLLTFLELPLILVMTEAAGFDPKKGRLMIRLVQYFGASLMMTLCGFLLLAFGLIDSEHELTFDLLTLKHNNAYLHDETLIFVLLFYGFAIRMPLFPFHGWLPLLAEQSKLTGLTVLILGIKLGVYAMIRFIFPLVPGVAEQWTGFVILLSLISIYYGALLAFMQNNAYRLLAFATLSHTGMLVFGLFSFNEQGLEGTLLLCSVYGLASVGMLFSISLIHKQTGTALIPRLGGLFDSHTALALLFLITTLSTVIMPGSLGFDAGHLLLDGVIEEHKWGIAVTILTGHVLAAGFLLRAFQRMFLTTSKRQTSQLKFERSLFRERLIALVICALHIGTGLNSMPLLNLIDQEVVELVSHYPVHSAQSGELELPVDDENDAAGHRNGALE